VGARVPCLPLGPPRRTYPTAIALAASGRVDVEAIVTGRYPLDDVASALRASNQDPGSIKPIVEPG
jgi:L-iditol 2-dehydrogenase